MTGRLHFHFLLSYIGEGNGNPLQCPCLENPRDKGAWWAAVYGVAQSRTRLKWLSSSSSSSSSSSYGMGISLHKEKTKYSNVTWFQPCYKWAKSLLYTFSVYIFMVQFSSVAQLCLTDCNPMNHSTPGLPVHRQFPESTHVHRVGDAIQTSHPLSSIFLVISPNFLYSKCNLRFPRWLSSKESTHQCRRHGFNLWVGKIPWRRKWQGILAWEIPWTEKRGGLQSMRLQKTRLGN